MRARRATRSVSATRWAGSCHATRRFGRQLPDERVAMLTRLIGCPVAYPAAGYLTANVTLAIGMAVRMRRVPTDVMPRGVPFPPTTQPANKVALTGR